ncbi:MAG: YkgJ family cysteine cluster protein [Vulcanimicrobiota bacterium]
MHTPPLQYDCISCGKSCSDFQVEITPQDVARIQHSTTTEKLVNEGFTPLQVVDDRVFVAKLNGSCFFLDEDRLCSLHKHGGFSNKPTACQTFPFAPMATPDGVFLGLSFYCTAVAQSKGRPLEGREAELSYLLALPECEEVSADSQWSLWGEQAVDWPNYLQLEEFCRAGVSQHPRYGLIQAVWRLVMAVTGGGTEYLSKPVPLQQEGLWSVNLISRKLIPVMESKEPVVSSAIARALTQDQGFESPALGAEVVLQMPPNEYPEWFSQELSRYLEHVLFRKALLKAPNVLARICLLVAAGELLATYAYNHAHLRERELCPDDFYKAVGIVEGRLMLHANGLEGPIQTWAEYFVELLQGLK